MSLAELGTVPGKVETIEQVGHYIDDPLAAFSQMRYCLSQLKLSRKTTCKVC